MLMDERDGKFFFFFSVKENGHKEYRFKVTKAQDGRKDFKRKLNFLNWIQGFYLPPTPHPTPRGWEELPLRKNLQMGFGNHFFFFF